MATYPPVTDRERDAALRRITDRHLRREDNRWSEANSDSETAAYEVLGYLRRRHTQLPGGLAADDVWDELVLSAWVYWDQRRRERELLHRGRRLGLSLAELGRYLGIGTRQGMRDYLDRLDALLAEYHHIQTTRPGPATGDGATDPLTRHAGATRAQRGADVHTTRARRAATHAKPARQDWIAIHRTGIAATLTALLRQAARIGIHPHRDTGDTGAPAGNADGFGADGNTDGPGADGLGADGNTDGPGADGLGDYLSWLAEDLDASQLDPGTFGVLGLVLGELRVHPEVTALPRNHGLRMAIAAADRLRADYAELRANLTEPATP
jgi:hypothetical protein